MRLTGQRRAKRLNSPLLKSPFEQSGQRQWL
jgi:hypothetical protein